MPEPQESDTGPVSADSGSEAGRALRTGLDCPVILPGDADWEQARTAWNVYVDQRPVAVVLPNGPEDVQATVRIAREQGVPVAVQPNGHGATEALSGTVLIKTARLQGLSVDVARRRARVEAGVKWQTLLDALDGTGLMGLPGSTGDVTVIGYHLGGGLPWFGRAYGAAAQYVRALEVIGPDGGLGTVTAESDPDLFWALCGGGGDFGVVTAMEIELLPERPVYGGALMWPAEHTADVLRAYHEATRAAPRELTLWLWLTTFPPFDPIPKELQGRSFANLNVTYLGTREDGEAALASMRAVPGLEADTMGEVALPAIGGVSGEPTDPMPAMDWSHLVADIDADFQSRLLKVNFPGGGTPLVACIRHLGGALAESGGTAAGAIEQEYLLLAFGFPFTPESADAARAHWDVLEGSLGGHLSGRTPFNMLGASTRAARAFPEATLERLRAIKAERDPAGVIRGNRPVATD